MVNKYFNIFKSFFKKKCKIYPVFSDINKINKLKIDIEPNTEEITIIEEIKDIEEKIIDSNIKQNIKIKYNNFI